MVADADDRPNILVIMADDHAAAAFGCAGSHLSPLDPTPTLDALAREGTWMTRAYSTNSICTPSRASLMTGQYSHRNGVTVLGQPLPPDRQALAIEMGRAGYRTAMIGKWHLSRRPEAFDHYQVLPGQGRYFDPDFFVRGSDRPVRLPGHCTDVITDLALEWLSGAATTADDDRPFFLQLHYKAPHDYFEHAPRYDDLYADVDIPPPPGLDDRRVGSTGTAGVERDLTGVIATSIGRRNWRRNYVDDFAIDDKWTDDEARHAAYQQYLRRYLRCVRGIDDNVARVIDHLRSTGRWDNTVVVYTSDQGMFLGEHDMQDKRWAYEPSAQMPLIVRHPDAPGGRESDTLIANVDLPATLLDFADVEPPESFDGRSFAHAVFDRPPPADARDEVYYQYFMHMAHHDVPSHVAVIGRRYKAIFFHGAPGFHAWSPRSAVATPPGWELYDLETDPHETNNLAEAPEHAETLASMKRRLRRLRRRIGADRVPDEPADLRNAIKLANEAVDRHWTPDPDAVIAISRDVHKRFGNPTETARYRTPKFRSPGE